MCGICGFNFCDKELVKLMANEIKHRGPDQHGEFVDKFVSLAHRRLSIIDLSTKGRQPIFNEDGSICIVYNGEIYNYQEIRTELQRKGHKFASNTDTEVIVHAYEEFGVGCLNLFNGCFAFAIYDIDGKKIFLARDRMGIKPLYYYHNEGKFIFASEIKSILKDNEIKREINFDVMNKFVTFRYIPEEETIFKNIYRILGGNYLVFDIKDMSLKIEKYWDLNCSNKNIEGKSEGYFVKKIKSLFEDSVKKRLISDVPLGVYLSGGIDSSAVVAMMKKINPEETIKTFSVGFEHDKIGSEVGFAKQVAEHFHTEHKEIEIKPDVIKELPKIIWHLDEPMSDPATVPNYILSKHAKKDVTVILTGDGGDDIFAGYDQFKFPVLGRKFRIIPNLLRKSFFSIGLKSTPKLILNKIYKYSAATGSKMFERFEKFIYNIRNESKSYLEIISIFDEEERKKILTEKVMDGITDFNHYSKLNRIYFNNKNNFLNNLLYMEIKRYLEEDLLMKPDRMGLAWAIEARVPFLDHRLAEFSFRIPPKMKLKGMTTKYIFKKSMHNVLPKNIIYRKKQPFQVPLDQWINADLKSVLQEVLSEKNIKKQGYFNYSYIAKIFKDYNSSPLFYGRQLWNLLTFEIWNKIYIEEEKPDKIF